MTRVIISSLFIIICVLSQYTVHSVQVNSCPGTNPAKLPEVDVLNCDKPPCIFFINTNNSLTLSFKAPRYLEKIAPRARAYVFDGFFHVDYDLQQDDGCVGVMNTPCPLAENEFVQYTYAMFISESIPPASLTLEFALLDKDNDNADFVCFQIDIQTKWQ